MNRCKPRKKHHHSPSQAHSYSRYKSWISPKRMPPNPDPHFQHHKDFGPCPKISNPDHFRPINWHQKYPKPPCPPSDLISPGANSYFIASTSPINGLSTTSTVINFTPTVTSNNIAGSASIITFTSAGTYVLQLTLPTIVDATRSARTSTNLSMTPVISAGMIIEPSSFTSQGLTNTIAHIPLFYYAIITVSHCGGSLSFQLNTTNSSTASVSLTSGQILIYRLAQ